MAQGQVETIVEALNRGENLTQKDATDKYGITRLAAIIHIIKKKNLVNVGTESVDVPSRYGNGKVKIVRYFKYTEEQLGLW